MGGSPTLDPASCPLSSQPLRRACWQDAGAFILAMHGWGGTGERWDLQLEKNGRRWPGRAFGDLPASAVCLGELPAHGSGHHDQLGDDQANRDGRVMHDNYGPMIWGGTALVLQLEKNPQRWRRAMLVFKAETVIQARGADLAVQIDALGRGVGSPLICSASLAPHPDRPLMWLPPTATMPCRLRWVGGAHYADRCGHPASPAAPGGDAPGAGECWEFDPDDPLVPAGLLSILLPAARPQPDPAARWFDRRQRRPVAALGHWVGEPGLWPRPLAASRSWPAIVVPAGSAAACAA